jgi:hypothetical protein
MNQRHIRRQFWYKVGAIMVKCEMFQEFSPFSQCSELQSRDIEFVNQRIKDILKRKTLDESTAMFSTLWILKQLEKSEIPFLPTQIQALEEIIVNFTAAQEERQQSEEGSSVQRLQSAEHGKRPRPEGAE